MDFVEVQQIFNYWRVLLCVVSVVFVGFRFFRRWIVTAATLAVAKDSCIVAVVESAQNEIGRPLVFADWSFGVCARFF